MCLSMYLAICLLFIIMQRHVYTFYLYCRYNNFVTIHRLVKIIISHKKNDKLRKNQHDWGKGRGSQIGVVD